ncbi:MAG: hypothetical protein O3A00_16650 [Planctomycetota bacterium]|nr:hypothetical protein [Planctomycetota bacterium]
MLLVRRLAALMLIPAAAIQGAEPSIRSVDIRGLRIGGTTRLTIDGAELLPNPRIVSSLGIAKQELQPKPAANRIIVDVSLANDVEPGLYTLRVGTDHGVSSGVVIAADHFPQQRLEAGKTIEQLPVAVHGTVTGSNVVAVEFQAQAKQRVICEVEAQRLGGQLRPVLHLHDPQGRHIAWSMPKPSLLGDAHIRVELPVAGTYTLKLHDLQYAAPAANFFRLKIGDWQSVDAVFPPAVSRAKAGGVLLIGSAGETHVSLPAPTGDQFAVPWSMPKQSSGAQLAVLVSDIPELVETASPTPPQQISAIPSAISGRLLQPGEQDKYRVAVKPESKLKFEIFAQRIRSPIDAILEIQNDKGGRLAVNDDAAGTSDPVLEYTVPKGVESVFAVISDTASVSGPNCIYRLVVTDTADKSSKPDFDVTLSDDRATVASGGTLVLKAEVTRSGYEGAIELEFGQLPKGVTVSGRKIAAGEDASLVVMTGIDQAVISQVVTRVRAKAVDAPIAGTTKFATISGRPLQEFQPWMKEEVALALASAAEIAFGTNWAKTPPELKLTLGGKIKLPVEAIRPVGFDGPVRLTLLTSQKLPRTNNNPDANRTLRQETVNVEIPPDPAAQTAFDAKVAAEKAVATLTQQQTAAVDVATKKLAADQTALKAGEAEVARLVAALEPLDKRLKAVRDELAALAKQTVALQEKIKTGGVPEADAKKQLAEAAKKKTLLELDAASIEAQRKPLIAQNATAQAKVNQLKQTATGSLAALEKTQADFAAKLKVANAKVVEDSKNAEVAAATAKNVGEISVIVPASLGNDPINLAFKAELLSRNKQQVLGTVYTEVRRFETLNPIAVKLTGPVKIEQTLDTKLGATVTLAGTLERRVEFKEDVTITVEGLPAGIAVPKMLLKADKSEFKLEIKFPANQKPGDIGPIKLFATGKLIASNPILNRTDDVHITIQLKQLPATEPKSEVKKK